MAKKPVSSSSNSVRGEGHAVTKSGNTVYVAIDPSSVVKYVRAGNDLLIHQDNGKVIRIRGFFTAQDMQKLELVYKYDGSEWPVKAVQSTVPVDDETGTEVEFSGVAQDSGSGDNNLLALAALGAAAIGIATGGRGGSGGGGGGTPEKPAPKSPELATKANADGTVTATGLAAAGSSVTVTFPDGSSRVVVAGADGKFSVSSLKPQETGNVTAVVTDSNGKSSPPKVVEYVDKVAPAAPDALSYTDNEGSITGKIPEKGVTDDARPTLSGKAEPGSTITVRDGTTVLGTTIADAQGNWTFRPTTALAEGEHKITFTATDKAKNESTPSAEFIFTVDTVAPPVPAVKAVFDNEKEEGDPVALTPGGWTNDATPEFTGEGAEAGTTIYFYDNGKEIGKTVVGTDGKWTFTPAVHLQDGKHSVTMKAVDKAGNTSAESPAFELNVDTVAPNAPSISQIIDDVGSVTGIIGSGKTTDDTKPTLSGSGAEGGSIVKIYDGSTLIGQTTANANGTWAFTPDTDLAEGTHVFTVTSTDKAGNEGPSSTPWTIEVDVTAPDAAFVPVIINASDDVQPNVGLVTHEGFTNDTTPRLNGKGAEPSGFIRIYEGDKLLGQVQADENGNWSFDVPARSEGSHSFVAKTVDAAGNEGSSSDPFTLTVDTTAPVASDAVITEVQDSAEPHTGNVVHGGLTNDARPVVSGTAVDGITLVRIYDGTTLLGEVEVTGGLWSFTPESDLLNGAHNFRIKAVDAAGNEGPYSPIWSVTVDTLAPNAPVIAQIVDDTGSIKGNVVDGKTTDAVRPKLSGGSAEAGSTVKIYDKGVLIGETTANANGTWSFTPAEDLVEGEHVFTVTSTDKAGNEGVPSSSWTITVDTTAPELPVISQVFDTTGDELTAGMVSGERRPTLTGEAEAGSVVTIYDNGKKVGTVVAEDDGTWSFEPKNNLGQGEHKFTVKATDAAGNSSEISEPFTFTVDTVAPDRPEITAITDDVGSITGAIKANGVTDDARPVLTGKAEAGSIVTIYDFGEAIGTVTADATGAWTFTPDADLTDGGHSFSVSATDAAGNVSPASKAFVITVDTVAPDAPQFTTGYDAVGPVIGEFNSGAIINDGRPKLSGSGAEPNAKVTIYQDGVAVALITADAGGQWNWKSDAALSDATYVFTATVTDTAGNVSAPSTGFTVSVDTVAPAAPMIEAITDNVAPIEGNVVKGGFTNDTTPTLSGSGAEANGTVRIYDGATLLGEVKADADGKWSFTPENALGSGVHSFTVVGVDAAGNVSVRSDAYSVTVDTLAPNAPAITQVLDDVGSVQGAVASGKTTDDTKPTLSGNGAEGGSIVKIYDNGVLIGQTTANASGTWAFTPDTDLIEGAHSFTVTATDAAGNESSASMPWVVVVDITPPDASFKPVISSASDDVLPVTGEIKNGETTNDTNPRLNGTGAEANGFIRIYEGTTLLGQVQADENGNWSFDVPTRPDGSHSFVAKTVDAAGNEGSSSDAFTLTIDTKAPTASDAVITQVLDAAEPHTGNIEHNGLTNDARPVISGTAIDGVTLVRIYDGTTLLGEVEVNGGTWSFTPDSDLSNGVHNFRIKAVDAAGNEGPYSPTWSVTVDTTAPNAPSITAVSDDQGDLQGNVGDGKTTDDRRPTLSGGSAEAGSTVKIYDKGVLIGETTANANGTWSFTPTTDLAEGSHVFTVTATDKAGNEGVPSASFSVVVDTVAPEQPSIVKIVNAAGEELTADMITSERRPILSGEAEAGSVVTIYDNGKKIGTVVAEDDGTWSFELKSNLAQGAHDFTVKATDASGIWSYTPVNALGNGVHTFTVVGVDGAGNVSVRSEAYSVTVDTLAPNAPAITQVMDDVGSVTGAVASGKTTDDTKPTISGSGAEGGATVKIYDKGVLLGETTANANGTWSFTPATDLAEGVHTFTATVTDQAGNESSASMPWSIEVDVTGPDAKFKPEIKSASDDVLPDTGLVEHNGFTNDTTPRLNGVDAEPNGFIRIYSGGKLLGQVQADASGNWTFDVPTLTEGAHSFIATTVDAAGNEGASSAAFTLTVDTTAPTGADAKITEVMDDVDLHTGNIAHNGLTNDARPVISGTAEAGISLVRLYDGTTLLGEVKVTGGVWSFAVESDLANGVHNFRVKAVDAAGNEGPYSPSWTVTVDTTAPVAPTITQVLDDVGSVTGAVGSGKTTDDTKPTISGSGAEGGSIVKIYDGTTLLGQTIANANGTWSFTPTTDLSEGVHTFTATSTDAAGNEGTASMPWSIEVDLTGPDASFKPKILNASDDVLPNTGLLTNGEFTNDTTPRLNGDGAEANGLIRIYSDGKLLGTVQADKDGNWSFDVPTLSEGKHDFIATTVDAAGNEGTSSEVFSLTVDTKAPVASDAEITAVTDAVEPHVGNIASGGLTNDARPVVSGTAKDGVTLVRIYDGTTLLGEVAVTDGAWTFKSESDLSNGVHNFRIKAVDAAGNEGPYSPTWSVTVDTAAPNAPSITTVYDDVNAVTGNVADGKSTDDLRPTLSGGSAEAGSTVKIYDKGVLIGETIANSNGTWTFTPATDLAEGSHVFTVTSTDKAGNESVPSAGWTIHIDLSVPKTPEITQIWDDTNPGIGPVGKGETTNDTTPTLSGKADAGTVVKIFVNGTLLGETVATAAGTWTYTGFVSDGTHTFTVQSVNAVGTESALSEPFTIVVSTAVPGTPSITEVSDDVGTVTGKVDNGKTTDDTKPTISGTADANATVNIYDNGALLGQAKADGDGKWTFTPATDLSEGGHAFTAKVVDGAGTEGQPSFPYTITVDTTAPEAPQFTSGYDAVGPVTGEFGDGAIINDGRPKLSGSGAEANAVVSIYQDGVLVGTVKADAGGQWSWRSPAALSDATYAFTATVTDAAGNVSAASNPFSVTVDTVAPAAPKIEAVTDDVAPVEGNVVKGGFTNDTTPTISGSGAEANGTVRIYDGATLLGEVQADASGIWSYTPVNALGNGVHTFTVVGVDGAGNVSVRSEAYSVTVDTLAPNAPAITQVMDDVGSVTGAVASGKTTDDTKPTISGSGAEGGATVKIYDKGVLLGETTANANGTWSFTPATDLAEGVHTFTATVTDQAGNESSASMPWSIEVDVTGPDAKFKPEIKSASDDVLPDTGLVEHNGFTNDTTPRLNGVDAEPNGFIRIYSGGKLLGQVQADASGNWTFDVPTLTEGAHSFIATTVDAAGNEGASSAAFTLTVDTTAPTGADAKITEVMDDVDLHTGNIAHNGLTNDARPVISGTAEAGISLVRLYDGTTLLGEVKVTGGVWSFAVESDLANGVHNFRVKAVDAAGNEGPYSPSWTVTVDTTAPVAPTITQVLDDVGSVTGAVGSGKTTDDTKPTISGSGAEGGSIVKIYDGTTLLGQTIANANGTWSFTPTTDLSEGVHTFTATSTDAAGNEGTASMPWSIEVDLTGPDASFKPKILNASDDVLPNTGLLTNGEFTNDTTPRLNGDGAEANGLIRIYSDGKLLGTVQADKDGNWSFDVPTLSEGKHDFIATTVDAAGNEGTSSEVFSLTVDTKAPVASDAEITAVTDAVEPHVGNIASGGLTNDARPVVSGTAKDGVTLVRIYDGTTLLGEVAVTDGAWTFKSESDLSNGVHNFRIKAVDAAGNEGPYSPTWSVTVDTAAPNAPSITTVYDDVNAVTGNVADGKSTDDLRPTLSGGSAEAGSTVKIYDKGVLIGETIANSNGTWTFTPATDLAEGSHVFTVTSTDKAGNESVPSAGWTIHIDLSVPKTPEITQIWDDTNPGIGPVGKGETTNDTTPTLSGKADAGTVVKIFVNGTLLGETVATAAGTWTYTGFVSDGTHTFTVQSVNAVGTESALSEPFTIVVSTAVPGTPSITEVSDDVGTVTGVVGNGKPTDDVRPEIKGTADANATINIYDNGSFIGKATADADGNWTFTPTTDLTEGNHALTAKMVDGAGVEGQPSFPYNIVIDTTAPDAPRFTVGYDGVGPVIGEFGDGAIINDNRPKLSGAGAEPNAMVSIYQGGTLVATVRADAGGQWSWKATDAIADGTYTFTAKTTDAAGNVSAASDGFKVTVDTVAPNKPVIAQITDDQEPIVGNIAKDGFTNDTTPTLKGTGAEPNGLVRIYDGTTLIGEINADASGAWSYTPVNPLSNGPHTFTVVSVDAAGNVSAKSDEYKITVDTLAPASPSITNVLDDVGAVQGTVANGKTTDDTKPRLSGSGAESGSIVKIYDNGTLIGQTIANPNGTWVFTPTTDLKEGAHSFTVTATDQAGNESGESIAWVVTVDLTPPAKPEITAVFDDVAPGIGNVPNGTPTNDPTPTLAGKGDAGTTIRVYDGTVLLGETTVRADGTWAYTAPLLADGSHTFTVASVDEAGNVSATSNSWSVVISTIPPEVPKIENLANNNGSELIQVANNGVTNDQDPLLTGTAQPNLVIRIYDNGALLGSTTADADGKWSFNFKTANVKLSEGYHSLTAAAVNELGFEGSQSFPRIVTIDITPPASPVIVSAADDVGSIINPAMPNGSLTDDTLPSFRGTTDAYHVIKLYRDGGILVGQATADGSGNWQIQLTEPLDSKTHNFYATATDPAGNTSINNSGIFKLTVDAIAPDAPKITRIVDNVPDHTGTITEGGLTNDPAPRVEGTSEANATINIYAGSLLVGTVKANSSGAWSMKLPEGLPDGSYVITATATDAAGNTGPASAGYTIVVDTRAPDVPQITHVVDDVPGHTGNIGNRQTTNDNLPLIVGKGEKGTTIAVYDNGNYLGTTTVDADGNWSYQVTRVLGDGTHKFTSTATDPAGNTTGSSNTLEIIIDTIAPSSPRIDDAYDSELGRTMSSGTFTKDTTPTLRGTAEAYSIVEIFDDVYGVIGTTTANGSGGWSFTPALGKELPDGVYNFKARATDLAGNTGPAMGTGFKLVIDTVPPVAPVIEQVIDAVAGGIVGNIPSNGLTNDTYPTLSGKAEAGTTLTFYGGPNGTTTLGTLVVPASGVWTYKTSYLSNGEHKFVVKSVDAAGNETYSKAPYVITVDSSAPSTPVVTSVYDSTQPVVGNISSNGWTNETKPTFQGTAEAGSTLTIIHNNVEVGTVLVGPDGKWTWKPTTDLKDGVNNFNFKATDAAGNTSGSTSTFTMNVDTVPPVAPEITRIYDNVNPIQGDVPKDGYTNDATPTIYVTAEAYSTVIIYDNGVEVARYTLGNTTSWNWTPSQNISEGDHVYTVKQIDRAGQESPLSEPWKIIVDLLAPPAPTILQVWDDVDLYTGAIGQGKLTNDDTPTVSGTGVAGTKITVYANGNAVGTVIVGADNKWSLTTNKLGQGTVLLTAKAEDQAGNQSATSNSWSISVDTVAPNGGTGSNTEFYMDTYQDISKGYFEITRSIPVDQFGVKAVAMYNGQIVATADVDPATGRYTLKVPFADDNGWNTYQFGLLDEAGNIMYYRNKFYEYNYTSALGNQYHSDVLQRDFYIINSTEKAPPPVIDFMLDLVGTVREFGYNNYATDATGFTLTGHAKYGAGVSGATVQLYVDGNLVGTAYPSSYSGRWNYNVTGLTEGPHVFTATYTLDGVVSTVSQPFTVTVDLTPPDIPVIVEVVADEGLYAGKVENGGITNDKTVQLKGTTEPFATVRIYNGSSQIGEAKADASGNWVYTTNALSDGTHTFRTLGVDKVGNLGTLDLTKPGYVITVDTQPPAAPAINDALDDVGSVTGSVKSDGVTDDTKPLLQGTAEYGSTVRIYGTDGKTIIGTAVADATTGKWTFQIPTDLAEGKHTFTAEAVDKAGNIGPKSAAFNITVDTTAPDTPKITRVVDDVAPKLDDLVDGSSTNDTRPTFYGTAEANSTVRVYVGGVEIGTAKADASGNWNFTPAADKALTEGTHVVTFKAMDAAGNLSTTAASFTVKVDLTAPAKPQIDQIIDAVGLETGPVSNNGTTDDSRPTFKGKGEAGGTVSIMANGKLLGTTIVEADGTWSFKPTAAMTVEAHTITVTVADAAGNVSVASDAWKITIIRPAGGEPQGFSADMPDSGDMHSFSARSAHSDPQADDWNEPQAHATPMSLDTSALLAELDVQDGQNYGEGGYDAEAYDDQSVLAGLIDLAQASSDTSGQAEQPAEEADVTQLIQDALTEPAPQESIDLSALPEEQAPAAGTTEPVTETQPVAVPEPAPVNTGDLDLERLLQQTSTYI